MFVKKFNLYLIKPSRYDDDGYVIRHWKGVLPSNTLSCLYGLTESVRESKTLGADLEWNIQAVDETVERVRIDRIIRSHREKQSRTLVCLAGVQSNQFARASDLAMQLREHGIPVIIGGFHVSGILATLKALSPELAALQRAGVSLAAGEAEGQWEGILRDALENRLQPLYNFLNQPPDISSAPIPRLPERLLNRYAVKHFTTLDCGRGCPFTCSFCTVIHVQGRKMRYRSVDCILDSIRRNFRLYRISYYFFTDDNFCRNQNWEAIFDGLIRLREKEGIPVSFMMQADTLSYGIPRFVEKAGRAGCSQVFIGLESLNEENLKAASKNQNKFSDYKAMIRAYYDADIAVHFAYILGFPFDTRESLREDLKKLMALGPKQASFFMLTPLPGSTDYRRFVEGKGMMDADLNNFDSFHATFRHGRMSGAEWTAAYEEAWRTFYGKENTIEVLRRTSTKKFWDVFMNFVWYKNAVEVEGGHPMAQGFIRIRNRRDRRPQYPTESRWTFFKRNAREIWKTLKGTLRLFLELEEIWLAARQRSPFEEKALAELLKLRTQVKHWRSLRVSDLQELYRRAAQAIQTSSDGVRTSTIKIPSRFMIWIRKWDVFSDFLTHSRLPLKESWKELIQRFRQGRFHPSRLLKVLFLGWAEFIFFLRFLNQLIRAALNS